MGENGKFLLLLCLQQPHGQGWKNLGFGNNSGLQSRVPVFRRGFFYGFIGDFYGFFFRTFFMDLWRILYYFIGDLMEFHWEYYRVLDEILCGYYRGICMDYILQEM